MACIRIFKPSSTGSRWCTENGHGKSFIGKRPFLARSDIEWSTNLGFNRLLLFIGHGS